MTRIYIPIFAALVFGLLSCKDADDRFSFKPVADSIYNFSIAITDSGGMPGHASMKRQLLDFTLQHTGQKDSLSIINFVFERLSITQPGIQVASSKDGSITVLPAGTQVTVSTEEVDTTAANEELFDDYYKTWKAILPRLRGDSLQVVINRRGEVQQVTGFERISERIAGESGIDIRTVRQYLRDYAGNESIRDLLGQLFFFLPGKEIQKGDQWVKNVTTIANAPVKFSYLVTATEISQKRDKVRLYVQSVVSAKTAEEGRQYAEGEVGGNIAANIGTGMPLFIEMYQSVTTHTDQYDVHSIRYISLQ